MLRDLRTAHWPHPWPLLKEKEKSSGQIVLCFTWAWVFVDLSTRGVTFALACTRLEEHAIASD